MSTVAIPNAQFQGQLTREQRVRVFVATAALVKQGWAEWTQMNESIVGPNLKILFLLKGDFAANRLLCLTDLITVNGYRLEGLIDHLSKAITETTPTIAEAQ